VFAFIVYWSLQLTTVTNSLLLQSTMPIMTLVMPSILFGERIRPLLVSSAALSLTGVVWIVTRGQPFALHLGGLNHGDLLALTGVFLYSAYATFLRKVPAIHHITLLAVLFAVGMGTLAVPYLVSLADGGVAKPQIEVIGAVLYVGIFPSLIAYAFFNRAVILIGSVRVGVYMNLPTVFGVFLAVLLLGERLETYHMVGAAIVLAAIFVSRRAAAGQTENRGERKP
jgi:drug/metabolite transporter (DMT)-like permease